MKQPDILFQETDFPTKWFYNQPAGVPIPPKTNYLWVWELCRCCGARMVYSEDDFNNMAELPPAPGYWNDPVNTPNVGICIMLNPDKSKILAIDGTMVDFVELGEDVLALRLKPAKSWSFAT